MTREERRTDVPDSIQSLEDTTCFLQNMSLAGVGLGVGLVVGLVVGLLVELIDDSGERITSKVW
jgi:hypothetical protein